MESLRVTQKNVPELQLKVQVNQGLLLLSKLLVLNAAELDREVEQELLDNPALERVVETDSKQAEADSLHFEEVPVQFSFTDADPDPGHEEFLSEDEEGWQPEIASYISLKEYLLAQMLPAVDKPLHPIAEFLVESLDENGYLQIGEEEVALRFNTDLETIRQVVQALQNCDPAGVGARSLQECLLLQVRAFKEDKESSVARQVLEDAEQILSLGWQDFVHERTHRLLRRLRLSPDRLQAATHFIRYALKPYPGATFQLLPGASSGAPTFPVEPDVIVRSSVSGFEIEIRGVDPESLMINRSYLQQYARLVTGKSHLSAQDQQHIRQYVERARMFIRGLQKRRDTIRRIMQHLVQTQHNFLLTGDVRFVQPITRSELAAKVGLHRSTIGRAMRNKYLQLPNGTVVSFGIFFKPALRTAMLIEQIIREQEDQARRLSDAEIAQYLAEIGIQVSRRAVAKYRQQSHILSSRWR